MPVAGVQLRRFVGCPKLYEYLGRELVGKDVEMLRSGEKLKFTVFVLVPADA